MVAHLESARALRRSAYAVAIPGLLSPGDSYRIVQSLRLLLCPVDLWRYHEFAAVLTHAPPAGRILDLSSPRLLAAHIARNSDARVFSGDITRAMAGERRVYGPDLGAFRCDGASLPFDSATFDFAYSVSAIEHFPDAHDSMAMVGIADALRPGARCVITVPVHPDGGEVWQNGDPYGGQRRDDAGRVFFCRRYDGDSFAARLVRPSGLTLESVALLEYVSAEWSEAYNRRTNRPKTLASIGLKRRDWHWAATQIRPVSDWGNLRNAGVACAVFRKD